MWHSIKIGWLDNREFVGGGVSSPVTGRGRGKPITEWKPENMSVDSDVNDVTSRLRLLTARYAGRHVVHSS